MLMFSRTFTGYRPHVVRNRLKSMIYPRIQKVPPEALSTGNFGGEPAVVIDHERKHPVFLNFGIFQDIAPLHFV
jgi:hypothetical protein